MLVENRKNVADIIEILKPLIIGKTRKGWKCNCGCLSAGPAEAAEIEPAGDGDPGQEMLWYMWSVLMRCIETGKISYSTSVSDFVDVEYLKVLFQQRFGTPEEIRQKEEQAYALYDLEVSDSARVSAKLPAGIAIQDNDYQTRFIIDWGREQDAAESLNQLRVTAERSPSNGSDAYNRVIEILKGIKDPFVYRKGPDPVHSYESNYLMDYSKALSQLTTKAYTHLFMQNIGSQGDSSGFVQIHIDIAFSKLGK